MFQAHPIKGYLLTLLEEAFSKSEVKDMATKKDLATSLQFQSSPGYLKKKTDGCIDG